MDIEQIEQQIEEMKELLGGYTEQEVRAELSKHGLNYDAFLANNLALKSNLEREKNGS